MFGNSMWTKKKDPGVIREIYAKFPKPTNIKAQKVDSNGNILSGTWKPARIPDMCFCTVQGGIVKVSIPVIDMNELAVDKETPLDRKKLIEMSMDAITIFAKNILQFKSNTQGCFETKPTPNQALCKNPGKRMHHHGPSAITWWMQVNKMSRRIGFTAYGNQMTAPYVIRATQGHGRFFRLRMETYRWNILPV